MAASRGMISLIRSRTALYAVRGSNAVAALAPTRSRQKRNTIKNPGNLEALLGLRAARAHRSFFRSARWSSMSVLYFARNRFKYRGQRWDEHGAALHNHDS